MKANQSITQSADQLGRHKSTISRELGRNEGRRGYRPKQACELALSRSQGRRNARENRLRKRLEFKTPAEVFHQSLSRVALRPLNRCAISNANTHEFIK